ncbi:MAG: hypothetical protein PHU29_07615 [Sulfuricurvum sp.]|uniref:hypothetical protein n=1 Tax=Sulfuricurvum sp. TaxID=2025608 RepID=UPI00262BCC02|nr:hypothetical protein [Sulfuricurvum sp.]MDD2950639.1 hypothetical protein [Sulfuricurvum sp.]MDD5119394.1 hypothetical protein [Sulfuricurvum sp.]
MRIHKIREAALSKYTPAPKTSLYKYTHKKIKPATLEEFYNEVHAKHTQHQEQQYPNKNAQEIESIMMQNRRLIEAQRNSKR